MPTKYDVFAGLIEKAPCSARDLRFKKPIYSHLRSLVGENLIRKENNKYVPVKNRRSRLLFLIIRYCLRNGLDYNLLLSKNIPKIISELIRNQPQIRPKTLQNNKENISVLQYLEKNQFILLIKKKPRKGIFLRHQLIDNLKELHNVQIRQKDTRYLDVKKEVLKIRCDEINPFDDKVFEFLSGSAQLEGGTITPGETREMILNDIYPDKPKKDIQMIKNLNEAMRYVLEHLDEDITVDHIREINKLVLFSLHRNAGKFKLIQNKIQGNPNFKTARPEEVPYLMDSYCRYLKSIKTKESCLCSLGYIHNEIQHIHPFSDGNSRTTRMIVNWILLKNNLPLLVIKMGCFDEYMGLTKLGKTRDDKKLAKLLHHVLLHENIII